MGVVSIRPNTREHADSLACYFETIHIERGHEQCVPPSEDDTAGRQVDRISPFDQSPSSSGRKLHSFHELLPLSTR